MCAMLPMVSVFAQGVGWMTEGIAGSSPTSGAMSASAFYFPIILPVPCVARRVWWANGATVSGGATIGVGVYSDSEYGPGTKLVSGSATQGTANEVQFVDVTDTALPPGRYWIGIASSSGSNTTLFRSATTSGYDASLLFMESVTALPDTATPVETSVSNIWLCGFSTTASP